MAHEGAAAVLVAGLPLRRMGQPEVAAAVVLLASAEAGHVVGHVLRAEGGLWPGGQRALAMPAEFIPICNAN